MLIGVVREDGRLQKTDDVLREAAEVGAVDGYPLAVLAKMFDVWERKHPSASQIASATKRRMVLETVLDYYAPPSSRIPLVRGSLIHKGLEKGAFPRGLSVIREKRLRCALPRHKDITLSGQIDVFFPDPGRLEDYKTCKYVPNVIHNYHILQLAVYYWLLMLSGYLVNTVAIDYIAWNDMRQVSTVKLPSGNIVPAVQLPIFQDDKVFEDIVVEAYKMLDAGYRYNLVPSMQYCNTAWCYNCPLKWACDRIAPEGEPIDPADFKQEDYV